MKCVASSCRNSRASAQCCVRWGGGGAPGPLGWTCRAAIGPLSSHHSCSGPSGIGVQGTTVAVVRVPFGWHQAPGLVQHLVASAITKVPPGAVIVVQYNEPDMHPIIVLCMAECVRAGLRTLGGGGPRIPYNIAPPSRGARAKGGDPNGVGCVARGRGLAPSAELSPRWCALKPPAPTHTIASPPKQVALWAQRQCGAWRALPRLQPRQHHWRQSNHVRHHLCLCNQGEWAMPN